MRPSARLISADFVAAAGGRGVELHIARRHVFHLARELRDRTQHAPAHQAAKGNDEAEQAGDQKAEHQQRLVQTLAA
jgi:hypothetical protein